MSSGSRSRWCAAAAAASPDWFLPRAQQLVASLCMLVSKTVPVLLLSGRWCFGDGDPNEESVSALEQQWGGQKRHGELVNVRISVATASKLFLSEYACRDKNNKLDPSFKRQ